MTPADRLLDFVRRNFSGTRQIAITVDTPLLSEQILDSMGITVLAAFIEETFGVPFDGTELRKGRVETVRGIAAMIAAEEQAS